MATIEVSLDELLLGSYVVAVSQQTGDVVIKAAGFVRSEQLIATLKAKGVLAVLIDPDKQLPPPKALPVEPLEEPVPDTVKPTVPFELEQVKAVAILNNVTMQAAQSFTLLADGTVEDTQALTLTVDKLLQSCERNSQPLLYLQQVIQQDDRLLKHSIRCACLMSAFCQQLQLPAAQAQQLTLAALLHDCGKVQLQQLFPDEALSEQQILPYSLTLLAQFPQGESLIPVVHSHLAPLTEQSDDAKLLAIVNRYALLQQWVDDGRLQAAVVQPQLLKLCGNWIDPLLCQQFLHVLGLYPPGSAVQLKSGRIALVLENNPRFADKPKVKPFYHSVHRHHLPAKVVDLARHSDDTIVGYADLSAYALDLRQYL